MLLITLDKHPLHCRVELDGRDISPYVRGLELEADVGEAVTIVRLTLVDSVTVIGEAGQLEFKTRESHD